MFDNIDIDALEREGLDLAWLMMNTHAPNLDARAAILAEDMAAFAQAPSESGHEDLVFSFETYLLTCESMGFPAQG